MKRTMIIAAACLGILLFGILGITLMGRGGAEGRNADARECEKSYLQEILAALKEDGFSDAGVTLTHVRKADGSRVYRLLIHHSRIERMEDREREELDRRLSSISLRVPDSEVKQEFLFTDPAFPNDKEESLGL